jgi:probable F420-dependent oxidoreductase
VWKEYSRSAQITARASEFRGPPLAWAKAKRSPRELLTREKSQGLRVKVRIGIGFGRGSSGLDGLDQLCDAIVTNGFDSLWLSEVLTGAAMDPLIGLGVAAARFPTLKIGTTMLAPGRNPVRLAKSLATLDRLSEGRLLVTLVPGLTEQPERDAIGVEVKRRGEHLDELLPLLRGLLSGEAVSYEGPLGRFSDVTISPTPVQEPLEFWLGGMARSSLIRCGRLADGWLPSFCAVEDAVAGRKVIDEAAEEAGRSIDPEHFGVSIAYLARDDAAGERALQARRNTRAGTAPIPVGLPALRTTLESFVDAGFSKFVLRPLVAPASWSEELADLAGAVGALQT